MRTTLLNTLKSKIVDQMSRLGRKKKSYIFGMIASFMMFGSLQGNAQCVISLDTAPTITIGTDPDNVCSVNYTLNDATLSGCSPTTTISVDVDGVGALFGQGFNFAVGTYTITYTENEGSTFVTQTLIVEDDDAPIVTGCPADQTGVTNADGTGDCLATVTWAPPSVSDNCPGVTLSLSVVDIDGNVVAGAAVGGQYSADLSPYTATYTATDVQGNTNATCTFSITVSDNEDPVVTCPTDVTGLSCGEDIPTEFNVSNGTDFAALTGASLSDNCDATSDLDVSYSDSGSQTSCAGGTITRTYTITDDASNAVTCQMTFTWDADTTAPAVTGTITDSTVVGCTASDAPDAETTVAGLEGLTGDLMIEDDCTADGDLMVSSSDASAAGTGSVLVVVTRTYTVKDACDNSSVDIVHTINVEADDSGLAIVAPNDISIEACQADDMTVTAGNAGFAYSETSVTLTSGDVTTFLALAGASITGPCEYTVTYIDSKTGTCPEVVTRTYTVTDSGSSLTDSQTITVEDTTAPVVTGTIDDSSVEGCDASDAPAETTVAGLENLDGTLTIADVCTADGALTVTSSDESTGTCPLVITRTYVVADACGNTTAGIVQTITVEDTTAPVVTGSITATTVEGCDASDAPAAETTVSGLEGLIGDLMISDACTADGALTVTSSDASAGTYPTEITRTYLVVDACGNTTADIVHTITVDETVAPLISCLDDFDFDLVDVNNCFADVDTSIVDIFDACTSEADMELTIMVQLQTSPGIFALPGAETISIVHNSMTNVFDISATNLRAGLNLVTVTAEDENGNSTTCTFYITVNDLFGPVINSCPNNITVTAAEGECEVAVNWTLPLISDPCDAVTYTASHNPNDFFAVDSTTTVTYEAMDPAGNITTCSFDITVEGDCPLEVDLRAQYSLQGNTYNEGDFRDQVVRVRNIGDDDSEGEISVFVSGLTAFDVVFDPNMTTANILIGTTTVNNQDWTATVLAGGVLYTSSVVIPAGSESKIGLSTEALVAGQDGNLNISILNNSGGDNDNTNNSANKFLVISLN